jgi:response regulator of citrate/malate metabolism
MTPAHRPAQTNRQRSRDSLIDRGIALGELARSGRPMTTETVADALGVSHQMARRWLRRWRARVRRLRVAA